MFGLLLNDKALPQFFPMLFARIPPGISDFIKQQSGQKMMRPPPVCTKMMIRYAIFKDLKDST
jgi:hypothetical protein